MPIIRPKTGTGWAPTFVTACLAGLLLAGCDAEDKTAAKPPPAPVVEVVAVAQQDVPIVMEFSGTVKAVKTVDVIPRVSGYIDKRFFVEGDAVKEGAPLYLIDPRPFKARLDGAKAQLESDEAALKFAESEVQRFTGLAATGAGSVQEKESWIAKRDEALAAIDKDKADIENWELQLGYTNITAPFAGRIEQTRINAGTLVKAQQDVLTTLVQIDPIYTVFNVSRRQMADVQRLVQQELVPTDKTKIKATVILPDGSAYQKQGQVDFISAQIDPTTDSVTVRAIFPNEKISKTGTEWVLVSGQYVPIRLLLGKYPKALVIPAKAIVESQAGRHVYVVNGEGKVESRKVELGPTYKETQVVSKGLKAGEQVIVEGLQKVRPGIAVKAQEAKASAGAS